MNHPKKILALLKAELKKVEEELYDEEGEVHSEEDAGVTEGMETAISIVEDYIKTHEE